MSKPMIVYTALTSFTWPWSDFILPKMLLQDKDLLVSSKGTLSKFAVVEIKNNEKY